MKICIVGPAHPYRGGLASIMEIMARTFASRGHDVGIKTFTVQYPSFLFPGKSQTVSAPPPADLHIDAASTRSIPSTGGAWGAPFAANAPISY